MNKIFKISIIAILAIFATHSHAKPTDIYKEGVHYFKVAQPLKVSTGSQIEVRELFWYGCPHCYSLEPHLLNWLKNKPSNAEFIATPAVFSKRWIFHAKAFYAVQSLGVEEEAHLMIFDSIHKYKKPVGSVKQLSSLLKTKLGIEEDKVKNALRSFSVDSNVRAANKISVASGADGVPTIIIDGKYRTSPYYAGGSNKVFDVVNFLIEKAQAER